MSDHIDATSVELVETHGQAVSLFGTSDPVEVLTKATAVANALSDVIQQRQLFANISGKSHVLVEGWQLLGSMLGVFPVETYAHEVEPPEGVKGNPKGPWGYEVRCEARTREGQIVGAGVARCTRSERAWSGRDDYALISMAQTRATSKALKGPLGFIINLAGYASTPAEEANPKLTKLEEAVAEAPPEGAQSRSPKAAELDEQITAMCIAQKGDKLGRNKAAALVRGARTLDAKKATVERLSTEIDKEAARA